MRVGCSKADKAAGLSIVVALDIPARLHTVSRWSKSANGRRSRIAQSGSAAALLPLLALLSLSMLSSRSRVRGRSSHAAHYNGSRPVKIAIPAEELRVVMIYPNGSGPEPRIRTRLDGNALLCHRACPSGAKVATIPNTTLLQDCIALLIQHWHVRPGRRNDHFHCQPRVRPAAVGVLRTRAFDPTNVRTTTCERLMLRCRRSPKALIHLSLPLRS